MRNKRFLAIAAAIAISISLSAPVTAFATEAEEVSDTVDDEQEEGEQTTIMAPDSDNEGDTGSAGGASGTDSSNSSGAAGSTKSSDSSLSHLGISPGSLSPAFSAGTHEYTATVDANVTAISVAAKPNSSNAVIASVSGAKSLKAGTNTVKVVVEAENGTTSTYTITVICGSATASAPDSEQANPAQDSSAQDNTTDASGAESGQQAPEGEILPVGDVDEEPKENTEVTFDDNGYLIYEGNAYLPSSMMPEGEYVSLDKYNKLYEQLQEQQTKRTRIFIIFIVLTVLLVIVILNLVLKLRDMRQDAKLGFDRLEDDERIAERQTDTSMIPDVVMPEQMKPAKKEKPVRAERTAKTAKPVKAEKTVKTEKTVRAEKPAKAEKQMEASASKLTQTANQTGDLEILDLNDL